MEIPGWVLATASKEGNSAVPRVRTQSPEVWGAQKTSRGGSVLCVGQWRSPQHLRGQPDSGTLEGGQRGRAKFLAGGGSQATDLCPLLLSSTLGQPEKLGGR